MSAKTKTKKKESGESMSLSFWTTGEDLTRLAREHWVSDLPKKAIDFLMTACMGMSKEQALMIISGKSKLIGSTRKGDGTLNMTKDGKTKELYGIPLDLNTMVDRLEKKYIELSESKAVYSEAPLNLNEDHEDFTEEDEKVEKERRKKLIANTEKQLAEVIENLAELYSIVGKTIKDLPIGKVRSYREMREGEEKKSEEAEKSLRIPNETISGTHGYYYLVHTTVEKCAAEDLRSGWLLPDGTFFGASCNPFVHMNMLSDLEERKFFKGKKYGAEEDDVRENGWVKLSGGHGWLVHLNRNERVLTKKQINFMIDYTVSVNKKDTIHLGSLDNISLKNFAKLLDENYSAWQLKEMDEADAKEWKEKNKDRKRTGNFSEKFGGFFYAVPVSIEKCKEESLHSGWLLPDGTFYGGTGYSYVHLDILEALKEDGFFEGKPYGSGEKDVEGAGWAKLSSGYGWQNVDNHTNEQLQFIIDYTATVDERNFVDIYGHHIPLTNLAKVIAGEVPFNLWELREKD